MPNTNEIPAAESALGLGLAVPVRCPECGALTYSHESERHAFNCSRITLEDAISQLLTYHAAWWKLEKDDREWRAALELRAEKERTQLKEQVTLWQGKFALVAHENNALRRKLPNIV